MPRQPRLDAPDTLHPVMVRGIERTQLFRDDQDRAGFVARLAARAVDAWALLPTPAPCLVRTGTRPLPRRMRSLRTSDPGALTRQHHQKLSTAGH